MIEYINIEHYKCFKDFRIEGLSRVNIISGKNNVGKTVLLEAFFLTDAHRGSLARSSLARSIIAKNRNIDENQYINYLKTFNYSIIREGGGISSFKVKHKHLLNIEELEEVKKLNNDYTNYICGCDGYNIYVEPLENENMGNAYIPMDYYINSSKPSNEILTRLYSEIQTKGIQHEFLEYLQKLDSNIKWIEPQVLNNEMVLRVNLKNPKMSLITSELGEGVNRYIEILSIMLFSAHESVFIDEIENGLHYSKLVDIAKAIIEIAEERNIQLFITTHDKDTIEAFAFACEDLEFKDLCSIELYKDKDNNLNSTVRNTEQFVATVDTGIEVR